MSQPKGSIDPRSLHAGSLLTQGQLRRNAWLNRVVLGAVVMLYLITISGRWYVSSDSALYLLLGESVAAGEGYTLWGQPHVHVPPGFPAILAALNVLGLGKMECLNLVMTVMSLVALWFCSRALLAETSVSMALLVTLTVALGHEMHLASAMLLSDVPFMMFFWLGLWCCYRGLNGKSGWLELGVMALVASCWIRITGFPLAFGAAVGLISSTYTVSHRRVWVNATALVIGLMLSAGLLYLWHRHDTNVVELPSYGHHFSNLGHRSLFQWLHRPLSHAYQTGPHLARLLTGQRVPGLVALTLFLLPVLIGMRQQFRGGSRVGLLSTITYMATILFIRPLLSRYLLPVAPLLVLYWITGIQQLCSLWPAWRTSGSRVVWICILLLLTINLPKVIRLTIGVHREDFLSYRDSWPSLREAARELRKSAGKDERFVSTGSQRTLAYLSQIPSISFKKSNYKFRSHTIQNLEQWYRLGVRLLVLHEDVSNPYFSKLPKLVRDITQARLVYEGGGYEIYRLVEPPRLAARVIDVVMQ